MRLVRNRGDLLAGIGDADGGRLQDGKRAVVIAMAAAQPVAMRIEGQQRHQQHTGGRARPMRQVA